MSSDAYFFVVLLISVILHCQRCRAQSEQSALETGSSQYSNFSCDFDTCYNNEILQDRHNDLNWSRNYYKPPTWTYADNNIYINEYQRRPGEVARFKTPVISLSDQNSTTYCIQFSYYMVGPYVGQLEVIIEEELHSVMDPIWSTSGLQGLYWNTKSILYKPANSFRVIFQTTVGSFPFYSYIGIDDLEIYEGGCRPTPIPTQSSILSEVNCNFESNVTLCGFTLMKVGNRSGWRHSSAYNAGSQYHTSLPKMDHTLNLRSGHYIYTDRYLPVIYSPLLTSSGLESCFSFWYHLPYSRDEEGLIIYLQPLNGHIRDPLAMTQQFHGHQWQLQQVPIGATAPVTFHIVIIKPNHDDAGIDDFLYKQSPCLLPLEANHTGNCNFELSLDECGYIQGGTTEDNSEWNLAQGPIANARETGPNVDHTFMNSSGHYMYIQTAFFFAGDKAKLFTPKITSTKKPRCLIFWYYMDNEDVGHLHVYLNVFNAYNVIWHTGKATEKQWKLAKVDFHPSGLDFKIVFQATVGSSYYRGTIAIDDIMIGDVDVNHIETFTCNFEMDMCGLLQRYDDNLNWRYFNTLTDMYSAYQIQIPDSSSFMCIIGDSGGERAYIQTPLINYTGSIGVSFRVFMNFEPELNLRVFIQDGWNYDRKKLIWEKNGKTQGWEQVKVMEVNQTMAIFTISFEAVLGNAVMAGIIAVDDVNIFPDNTSLNGNTTPIFIITAVFLFVTIVISITLLIDRKLRMNESKDLPKNKSTKVINNVAYDEFQGTRV